MAPRVTIVGASLAGLRSAEAVRALLPDARITLIGDEPHAPYNRPPLSKDVAEQLAGADAETQQAALAKLTFKHRLPDAGLDWRLGVKATGFDADARSVRLSDGGRIAHDWLIAASGLRPRRLPFAGAEDRRHVLRSFDDAARLGAQLVPGARMLVVGAGFIGCEIAATAAHLGLSVTVIEPQAAPMLAALGPDVAQAMAAFHRARGIDLRCGLTVTGLSDANGVTLTLSDGSTVTGDLLVEAVGSLPNTEWLTDPALDLSNGVLTDATLTAPGNPRLLAVGDLARFPNPLFGPAPRRVEHWCVPGQTAKRAAETIAARAAGHEPAPGFAPMPSFWSDQHGMRLQSFGAPALADAIRIAEGRLDRLGQEPCLVEYLQGGRLIGLLGLGLSPAHLTRHRPRLDAALNETVAA